MPLYSITADWGAINCWCSSVYLFQTEEPFCFFKRYIPIYKESSGSILLKMGACMLYSDRASQPLNVLWIFLPRLWHQQRIRLVIIDKSVSELGWTGNKNATSFSSIFAEFFLSRGIFQGFAEQLSTIGMSGKYGLFFNESLYCAPHLRFSRGFQRHG